MQREILDPERDIQRKDTETVQSINQEVPRGLWEEGRDLPAPGGMVSLYDACLAWCLSWHPIKRTHKEETLLLIGIFKSGDYWMQSQRKRGTDSCSGDNLGPVYPVQGLWEKHVSLIINLTLLRAVRCFLLN